MESISTKASVKMIRIAPRKVRLVADLVRGKDIREALAILDYTNKASSPVIAKVVKSAVANAVNNNGADETKLFVEKIYVDEGPTLKRFMTQAKGSAHPIMKRTSHITVFVAERS